MSEVMTVETIVEAYLQTKGYYTKTRVSVKKENSYLDIDVLGYNNMTKTLAFAESKSHGKKTKVFYRKFSEPDIHKYNLLIENKKIYEEEFEQELISWKESGGKKSGKAKPAKLNGKFFEVFNFLSNINYFIERCEILNINIEEVENIYILFVSNCYYDETGIAETYAKKFINFQYRNKIKIVFKTHFDLLIDLINAIKPKIEDIANTKNDDEIDENDEDEGSGYENSVFGKRYGHPVLDLIREFNRYVFITIADGSTGAPKESLPYIEKKRKENQNKLYDIFNNYNESLEKENKKSTKVS